MVVGALTGNIPAMVVGGVVTVVGAGVSTYGGYEAGKQAHEKLETKAAEGGVESPYTSPLDYLE